MICPACHSDRAFVHRTQRTLTETSRACRCECGASWVTDERVRRGSLVTGKPSLLTHGQNASAPQAAESEQRGDKKINDLAAVSGDSHARKGGWGVLPSGSGPLFSVSGPDSSQPSDPDHLERSSTRSPARAKRPAYSEDFEALWDWTGRCRGNKGAAWDAYRKVSSMPLPRLFEAWTAYMASSGPQGGFVQHLSTWLNQRGWETQWQPAKGKTRDDRNSDVIAGWLAKEAARG